MEATFNYDLLHDLQLLVGISVLPQLHIWGTRQSMRRRVVKIEVNNTTQHLKHVRSCIDSFLSGNLDKKLIVYTNTAEKALSHAIELNVLYI